MRGEIERTMAGEEEAVWRRMKRRSEEEWRGVDGGRESDHAQ